MRKTEDLLRRLANQEILFCELPPSDQMRVVFVHYLKQLAYCMANCPDVTMDFYYTSMDQALGDEVDRIIYPLMREEYNQGRLDAEYDIMRSRLP